MNPITSFDNEYKIFSNFYPCNVYFEEIKYPTVEHAFIAAKTNDTFLRIDISKIPANKAGLAKRMGRKIKLRENWELVKLPIMKRLLYQKFTLEQFRKPLVNTGEALIIEGNYWHDNYWGECYCKKCINIKGQNHLGKLLMAIRKNIQ